jgi:hypothetical protein
LIGAVAERSGDTAFPESVAAESGVALRFPPQSKMDAYCFRTA